MCVGIVPKAAAWTAGVKLTSQVSHHGQRLSSPNAANAVHSDRPARLHAEQETADQEAFVGWRFFSHPPAETIKAEIMSWVGRGPSIPFRIQLSERSGSEIRIGG